MTVSLPEGGSYDGWEQVAETRDRFEAEMMALRLREAGIPAEVLDGSFRQTPLPDVRSFAVVRVLVPTEQADVAREALERAPWLTSDLSDEPEAVPALPEEPHRCRDERLDRDVAIRVLPKPGEDDR